ncbi:hypothetical protein B7463_g9757, partial [Scytalidium lignicola]
MVTNILKSKGYLGYMNGNIKCPKIEDSKETPEFEAWEKVDSTAKLCISLNINEEANALISECFTSKEAWETLKAQYQGSNCNLKEKYILELVNVKYKYSSLVRSYVTTFKALKSNLISVEVTLSDVFYKLFFHFTIENRLEKYPKKYEEFAKKHGKKKDKDSKSSKSGSDFNSSLNTVNLNKSNSLITLFNVYHILTFPVNVLRGVKLLNQGREAYIIVKGIYNKNGIEFNVVDMFMDSIYLKLANTLKVLLTTLLARQSMPSLDLIHQRLSYTNIEVIKNTIKATTEIDKSLIKAAEKEETFLFIPPGYNKYNYTTIIVNDVINVTWGYTHKEKKGTYDVIIYYITLIKNQYGTILKRLHIDGGNEFDGKKLDKYIQKNNIEVITTTLHTPYQEGHSESAERIVFMQMHTMMIANDILQYLWPEYYKMAIIVGNQLITLILKNNTPYAEFIKQVNLEGNCIPDISNLQVINSKVLVHINANQHVKSQKIAPKAEEGILLSFESNSIYRCWVSIYSYKLVQLSYVTFTEGNTRLEDLETLTSLLKALDVELVLEDTIIVDTRTFIIPNLIDTKTFTVLNLDATFEEVPESFAAREIEDDSNTSDIIQEVLVIQAPKGHGRPKGSKNKKPDTTTPNIDLSSLQSTRARTTTPSQPPDTPVEHSPRASTTNNKIIGQPTSAAMAYGYCLFARQALNTSYALTASADPLEPNTVKEALQDMYIDKILERFGYNNMKPAQSPIKAGVSTILVKNEDTASTVDIQLPDLAFTTSKLSQFLQNPSVQHLKAVKHVY